MVMSHAKMKINLHLLFLFYKYDNNINLLMIVGLHILFISFYI